MSEKIDKEKADKLKKLESSILNIEKEFGKGSIMQLGKKPINNIPVISTGDLSIDTILGVGGFPKGRIVEIYGPESCLDKDTFILYDVEDKKTKKRINHKGGTIETLYERFHNKQERSNKYGVHNRNNNVDFYVSSVNDENRIIKNKVVDVVKCGIKQVFKLTDSYNNKLICTEDHKFMTKDGFKALKDLKIGDIIYIHNNTPYKGRKKYFSRQEKMVKYHPNGSIKKVGKYIYYRKPLTHFIYESHLNNMSLNDYLNFLNTKSKSEIDKLNFIPKNMHIHHKDEDFNNNSLNNLELIDPSTHGLIHSTDRHNNLRFIVVESIIESIEKLDERMTFDIKCIYPYNNYVANKFVVHNSGKTTLALHGIAESQKAGGIAAFVDAEHALDPVYAKALGVNTHDLWVSQPDTGEQALEIVEKLASSGSIDIIVIDSVAALTPKAEIEGDMGDSVTFDTPVYIRNKIDGFLDIVPISDLFGSSLKFSEGHSTKWYRKFKSTEVLTHEGWKDINGVVVKDNSEKQKPVKAVQTVNGFVKATEDHCFFQNKEEKSIKELDRFDRIDIYENNIETKKINTFIDEEVAWLLGFWVAEGSTPRTENSTRFEVCNAKKEIINKCYAIVTDKFMLKAYIRERDNEAKLPLHILSCTASKNLGSLMQQCMCKKSKLKKVPAFILNASNVIQQSFIGGFYAGDGSHDDKSDVENYYNNSLPVIAGIQFMLTKLNKETAITINKNRLHQLTLRVVKSERTKKENEILSIEDFETPDFLWDISTEAGTFITALGNIVVHNSHMGLQARLLSQAMRKLTGIVSKTNTCVIFINQLRMKIGVMFGNPEVTTGGNALKFYASIRIEIRRTETLTNASEAIGNKVRIKIVKNKLAPPFKETFVEIYYGRGIDKYGSLVNLGVKYNIIEKSGSWYSYNNQKLGQGKENARKFLEDNKEICEKIEDFVKSTIINNNKLDDKEGSTIVDETEIDINDETKKSDKKD